MRPFVIVIFSSLVYWSDVGQAAPTGDSFEDDYQYDSNTTQEPSAGQPDPLISESLAISRPEDNKFEKRRRRVRKPPKRMALSSFLLIESETKVGVGLNWLIEDTANRLWQIEIMTDTKLRIRPGASRIYLQKYTDSFRTLWLWGLTHRYSAKDQLASILNRQNTSARLGVGLEQEFSTTHFRITMEALMSLRFNEPGAGLVASYLF